MSLNNKNKSRLSIETIKDQLAKTKIIPRVIDEEVKNSFLEYAMSVIISRALPDARDGFKPVHRRVLWAAYGLGLMPDKPYKKSARLVGEVIGKYHPHGDTAAYETMVRMAQDFSLRYTLMDGHGNFGSIDGDSPAAMRYTEIRLDKHATEMLKDIDKDTVDFVPNYDDTESEPTVLPSLFPNLLANGTSGIAVGMSTNMPPHNLKEVCLGAIALANNRNISISELSEIIKGPDFPTGATIIGHKGISDYFNTGHGSVIVRSKTHIEEIGQKEAIVVTEIPYQVNKKSLIDKIVELVKSNEIEGISDLRDESNRHGMRIVIELKKDVNSGIILNKLYKSTRLQNNFPINCLALVNNEPKILNLKELLTQYLNHQYEVLVRKTKYELKKYKEKAHILNGLVIAVNNIDEVIKIIKSSADNEQAANTLMQRFNLDEIQAKAILDMKLRALTNLEHNKLINELNELNELIKQAEELLGSYDKQTEYICDKLNYIINKYGDERKTEIIEGEASIDDESLIPVEDIVITMSKKGYLKRLSIDTYKTQHRGGCGVIGASVHEEDDIAKIIIANTHQDLLMFSDKGKVYRIRGYQVPLGSRTSKGIPAINLIEIEKSESILTILPINDYTDGYLVFTTQNGLVKRTKLTEFDSIRKNGKIAITLKDDDSLFSVLQTNGNDEMFVAGSNGKVVRFKETDVRSSGRTSMGVKGISLSGSEKVVGTGLSNQGKYILSIGSKGLGKLSSYEDYRQTKRGAKGVTTLKVTPKTGNLIDIKLVNGDEDLLLFSSSNKMIRIRLSEINIISRNTSGVKLIDLDDKEKIISVGINKPNDSDEFLDNSENNLNDYNNGENNE